ncbi:hypothetical protein SERLA73DRAFT_152235 [Serpula lacrymans var. lacrymans S7.3]|uniref:TRP C-terminal domain-containing protein n=2 Tax=Serpula lacrymans var. lacrymans TaxID=341189 RepID=F8PVD7_SERL3|nr:uncharacterized protein SERLADRAFT_407991 [Serpula lacrymans var. lacrymans S7.9]EGO00147.1 hypothetical protein SERLA73DRAFT_152235 [Serpula lacrymans var. lacrymans S7.3]EGO25709.1 hypothetical protein SERLADRAFT_407991 [Serpula lacrymans var. lacrymans S7.9]
MSPSLFTLPSSLLLLLPILALSLLALSLAPTNSTRVARSSLLPSYAFIASLGLFAALAGAFGVAATQLGPPDTFYLCALVFRVVLECLHTLSALIAPFLPSSSQQIPALLASTFQLILNVALLLLPILIIAFPFGTPTLTSSSQDGASTRYLFPKYREETVIATSTTSQVSPTHPWPEPDIEAGQRPEFKPASKYSSPHSPTLCTWPFPGTLGHDRAHGFGSTQPVKGVCEIDTKNPVMASMPRIRTDLKADVTSRRGKASIPMSISFVLAQIFALAVTAMSLGNVVLSGGDVGMGGTETGIEVNLDIARGVFLAMWAAGMLFSLFFVHYRSGPPLSIDEDDDFPSPTSTMSTLMSPMTPGTPAGQGPSQMHSPNQSPSKSSTMSRDKTQSQGEMRGPCEYQNQSTQSGGQTQGQDKSAWGFSYPRVSKPISMTSLRSSFGLNPRSHSMRSSSTRGADGRCVKGGKGRRGAKADTPPTSDSDSDFCSLRDPFASPPVVPVVSVASCTPPPRARRTAPELELGDTIYAGAGWAGCGGVGGGVGGWVGGVKPQYRFEAPGSAARDRSRHQHGGSGQSFSGGLGLNFGMGLKTRSAAKTLMSAGQMQMPRRVRKKASGALGGGGSGGGINLNLKGGAKGSGSTDASEDLEVFDAEEAWLAQLLLKTLVGDEQARVEKEKEMEVGV